MVSGTALSVVVVDVDYFKQLNDRYGHLYGDEVLKRIGSLLQQALRAKDDFAARFGGEEFVILLPATHQAAAMQVAERLRKMVELAGFPALDPSQKPYDTSYGCDSELRRGDCLSNSCATSRSSCWRPRTGRCTRPRRTAATGCAPRRRSD